MNIPGAPFRLECVDRPGYKLRIEIQLGSRIVLTGLFLPGTVGREEPLDVQHTNINHVFDDSTHLRWPGEFWT